jgi:hypothetical protein
VQSPGEIRREDIATLACLSNFGSMATLNNYSAVDNKSHRSAIHEQAGPAVVRGEHPGPTVFAVVARLSTAIALV